jgi:hypothetical protein
VTTVTSNTTVPDRTPSAKGIGDLARLVKRRVDPR